MSFMCKSYSVVVVVESKSAVMRSAEAKSYSVVVIEVVNVLTSQKTCEMWMLCTFTTFFELEVPSLHTPKVTQ